jgi:hypothetical protein
MNIHGSSERDDSLKPGSARSFGIVFAIVFAIVGLFPLLSDGGDIRHWGLVISSIFLGSALFAPAILMPLNRIWFKFGLLLHKFFNPLVMAIIFFVFLTPMALIVRFLGKLSLERGPDRDATSYWIAREPAGPSPKSMINQF